MPLKIAETGPYIFSSVEAAKDAPLLLAVKTRRAIALYLAYRDALIPVADFSESFGSLLASPVSNPGWTLARAFILNEVLREETVGRAGSPSFCSPSALFSGPLPFNALVLLKSVGTRVTHADLGFPNAVDKIIKTAAALNPWARNKQICR